MKMNDSTQKTMSIDQTISTIPAKYPTNEPIRGVHVTLHRMTSAHTSELYDCIGGPGTSDLWKWLKPGPFTTLDGFRTNQDRYLSDQATGKRALYTIFSNTTSTPLGFLGLVDLMDLPYSKCELGPVVFAPSLQRTRAATEVNYLIMRLVFEELGFRRYEWTCDKLNVASKRAAERFGFVYEGCLRQEMVVKGNRLRDTLLYSILSSEWPGVKACFERWLEDDNFDEDGMQMRSMLEIRELLAAS